MKILFVFLSLVSSVSFAKIQGERQPAGTSLEMMVQSAVREGLAKEMKVKVEIAKKSSVCGGPEGETVFATVSFKKMQMAEGGAKETWEEYDHFAASLKDFKKTGFKSFMRDNQCME